jgi:hypothetical protein
MEGAHTLSLVLQRLCSKESRPLPSNVSVISKGLLKINQQKRYFIS